LLVPCSRVLLEKLAGSQLVKKFPAFYGTRKFITTFTTTRQLSLSLALKNIQISNIIKNRPMGEELLHADGLTYIHDENNSRFSEFFEDA
jgi:hypothetical protein